MRKYCIFILLIFSVLFINVSGVNARPDGGGGTGSSTCDYGVVCTYEFCGDDNTNCDLDYGKVNANVVYRCSGSKDKKASSCTKFTAWKTSGYKNNASASPIKINFNVNGVDTSAIDFSDEVTGDENATPINFRSYFKENGYKCPQIVVSGSGKTYTAKYYNKNDYDGTGTIVSGTKLQCVSRDDYDIDIDTSAKETAQKYVEDAVEQQFDDVEEATGHDAVKVDVGAITTWAQNQGYDVNSIGDPCNVISPKLKNLLNTIFWAISIIGIILVVVMTALSFIKALVGADDEKIKDAFKHLLTRIIVVIVLLLLPMILSFIITLVNDSASGEVSVGKDGNVFCDIAN